MCSGPLGCPHHASTPVALRCGFCLWLYAWEVGGLLALSGDPIEQDLEASQPQSFQPRLGLLLDFADLVSDLVGDHQTPRIIDMRSGSMLRRE